MRYLPGNETAVIRWDYGDPSLGTCKESIEGGNHLRYWVQNGPSADRYILLCVSIESRTNVLSVVLSSWPSRTSCPLLVRTPTMLEFMLGANPEYEEQHDILANG